MEIFVMYLKLGFYHIADIYAYDHILFVSTLCAVYLIRQWREILVLITAFTIGHSLTLALATFDVIRISSYLVELLIPITIIITCVSNIFLQKQNLSKNIYRFKYLTALLFGLIHGLGFSNYLRSLLGSEMKIFKALLAFNVGLEIGQILIVSLVLTFAFVLTKFARLRQLTWNYFLSGIGFIVASMLIVERI